MQRQLQKEAGVYYTPDPVVASLIQWVLQHAQDRALDPACGDGRFISHSDHLCASICPFGRPF
jgi:adenine-specific DNA-methyltransferase